MDIHEVIAGVKLFREAVGAFRDVLASGGPSAEELEVARLAVEKAERELRAAEAVMAQGLGYHLCQCEWPPNIMLGAGGKVRCPNPKCGHYEEWF